MFKTILLLETRSKQAPPSPSSILSKMEKFVAIKLSWSVCWNLIRQIVVDKKGGFPKTTNLSIKDIYFQLRMNLILIKWLFSCLLQKMSLPQAWAQGRVRVVNGCPPMISYTQSIAKAFPATCLNHESTDFPHPSSQCKHAPLSWWAFKYNSLSWVRLSANTLIRISRMVSFSWRSWPNAQTDSISNGILKQTNQVDVPALFMQVRANSRLIETAQSEGKRESIKKGENVVMLC